MDTILPWRRKSCIQNEDKLQTLNYKMEWLESKASDICDEVLKEELQNRKRKRGEVNLWLERVERIRQKVKNISDEVEDAELEGITKQVDELLEQGNFPRGLMLDDVKPDGIELVTEKLEGSTPLEVQNEVWCALLRGESRIGIYGMGGVGKTSVAMHINNEILAGRDGFKRVYYVTVSRDSSVHKLQGDISRALQLNLQIEDHETKRAAELRMSLKKRVKSLLILDDIWEDIPMEKVGVAVEGDGCKLLITTRKRDVCRKMNCSSIVEMKPLLEKEAWDLFVNQLGNYEQLSDEAKCVARSICEECSGLPLAIITMARCMRGEFDKRVWREMLRQLENPSSNQNDMDSKVFNILKLSYERLNNKKLQECLLYCALYPEDDEIQKNGLINLFITVGLIDGSTTQENIDKGHFMLNALESASLLEFVTDYVGERCVKMHDLIRDMTLKIIGCKGIVKPRKGLTKIPQNDEWTKDLVLVSLMHNEMRNIGDDICPECPNLSVLILRSNPLENISQYFFLRMTGLKILDLSSTSISKLPNSISNLCNLNALLLHGCHQLKAIPSLAGLAKLRNLNLSCTEIKELPVGVEELINLKYLGITGTMIQSIPDGLLCNLYKLESFLSNYKINIFPRKLRSLRQLLSFEGWIDDFDAFKKFVGSDCFNQLERYFFYVGGPTLFTIFRPEFSPYVRRIIIRDCELSIRREVCFKVPHNVQILELEKCSFGVEYLLEALPSLYGATELELCQLAFCKGIKYIISDALFDRGEYEVSTPIKGVRRLDLVHLDDFVGLYEGEAVRPHIFFGGLRELRIDGCPIVNKIWLQSDVLPNLESIEVAGCKNLEEVFATTGAAIELPCLKSISLCDLSELRIICRTNVLLPCLEKVNVKRCPNQEKLWSVKDELPSLKDVSVEFCDQMKEIFARTDEITIKWPKLCSLTLDCLPELKSICRSVVFFPELQRLEVYTCPKLKKLGLLNHSMPFLREISIMDCKEMEEIFERRDGGGDNAIQLLNLERIILNNLPELRSISRKAIVCNSLKEVFLRGEDKLENCPISVPRLLASNNPPLLVLQVRDKPKDWWNSLFWNDHSTKLAFYQLYFNNKKSKAQGGF